MGQLILTQNSSVDTPASGAVILANKNGSIVKKDYLGNESTLEPAKNRIINGDMRINQRNPSASGATTTDGGYTVDRFFVSRGGDYGGTLTWTWDTDVPTVAQAGRVFTKSLKLLTTQDTTPGVTGYVLFHQNIEGYNIEDILGSSYNTGFTLSFWIKNSNIGTYCVAFRNSSGDRTYIAEYTINNANTWEKKTITVTSAPTGTWVAGNGLGLRISWTLVTGTDTDDGVNGSWVSTNEYGTANQKNWADVASNVWITGVQLEAGTSASNFEYRPYGQELALCQRYCYVPTGSGTNSPIVAMGTFRSTTNCCVIIHLPVQLRNLPTLGITVGQWLVVDSTTAFTPSGVAVYAGSGLACVRLDFTVVGATLDRPAILLGDATGSRIMIFDAEL